MTDAEMAQLLQKRGIQPDIQGRSLKSAAKIQEKQTDQGLRKAETMLEAVKTMNEINREENGQTEEEGSEY
jgi:hypothetical protein